MTGLAFSTSNMLQVHFQLTNTQIELGQAFALLHRLRLLIGAMTLAVDVPTASVTHLVVSSLATGPGIMTLHDPAASVQTQYINNLRSLMDSFTDAGAPPPGHADHAVHAVLAVEVVDLT